MTNMSNPAPGPSVERLVEHGDWARAVARALVADENLAADLEQEVWMEAIEHPPSIRKTERGWLFAALRHNLLDFRRSEKRRRLREESASRPEGTDATAHVVAEADAHRVVVNAVMELEEPYRSTVLLRYFENRKPGEIAAVQGVPVETVRTRLRRALARLGVLLDGGEKGKRRLILLPLVAGGPEAGRGGMPPGAGGALLGKGLLAVAAAVLLTFGGWWAFGAAGGPGAPPLGTGLPVASVPSPPPPPTPVPAQEAPPPPAAAGEVPPAVLPEAKPEPAGAVADGVALLGRVVDGKRRPVGGAIVTLVRPGEVPLTATSATDGTFTFAGVERPVAVRDLGMHALDGEGRAGTGEVRLTSRSPATVRVDPIVAGPADALRVRVSDGEAPVAKARVLAGRDVPRSVLPDTVWMFEAITDDEGIALFPALPRGTLQLVGTAKGTLRGTARVQMPDSSSGPFPLVLKPARTIEVTVVEKGTGTPIQGATFQVRRRIGAGPYVPLPPVPPSDAEGKTRISLTGPEDGLSLLGIQAPGHPGPFEQGPYSDPGSVEVKPGETSVRIELASPRTVRVPVTSRNGPVPPDGASIRLRPRPGMTVPPPPPEGRMEGNTLVISGVFGGALVAVAEAPDGSMAEVHADADEVTGRPASFRPPLSLEVHAVDAEGRPVAGASLSLRDRSDNAETGVVSTDETGTARFEGLYFTRASLYLLDDPSSPYGGREVGQVSPSPNGARFDCVLGRARDIVLRVTLDGKPGLPSSYVLQVDGPLMREVEEDPEGGLIRFSYRPLGEDPEIGVLLRPDGYLPASETVPIPPGSDPVEVDLPLSGGRWIQGSVGLPPDGEARLILEKSDGAAWEVVQVPSGQMFLDVPPGGALRVGPLEPGRYRLWDSDCNLVSGVADLTGPETVAEVAMDLSHAGLAQGKVELPPGVDAARVRVRMEGEGLREADARFGPLLMGVPVQSDGSFSVRVPGDRRVRLLAWHPSFPSGEDRALLVTEPREGIVLALAAPQGAAVVFRVSPEPPPMPKGFFGPGGGRVLLFKGEAEGKPDSEHTLAIKDGVATFSGYEPGTWTLWIDIPGFAPKVLQSANLSKGGDDFGTLQFSEGTLLRIRVVTKGDETPPRIIAMAKRVGEPAYARSQIAQEQEILVRGLGKGTFHVQAGPMEGGGMAAPLDETIEVDGSSEKTLTLDLR